jgi:hypothetical protein
VSTAVPCATPLLLLLLLLPLLLLLNLPIGIIYSICTICIISCCHISSPFRLSAHACVLDLRIAFAVAADSDGVTFAAWLAATPQPAAIGASCCMARCLLGLACSSHCSCAPGAACTWRSLLRLQFTAMLWLLLLMLLLQW